MKPTGHLAGGYLTSRAMIELIDPPPARQKPLLLLGTLAGMLPDLDSLYYVFRYRSLEFGQDYDHHRWLSHTFPFYWIPALVAYLYGKATGRHHLQQVVLVAAASTTTHLLQDAIGSGSGLMWAWPFSRRMGGICTLHVEGGRDWLAVYNKHPIAWVERLIVLAAVVAFCLDLLDRVRK